MDRATEFHLGKPFRAWRRKQAAHLGERACGPQRRCDRDRLQSGCARGQKGDEPDSGGVRHDGGPYLGRPRDQPSSPRGQLDRGDRAWRRARRQTPRAPEGELRRAPFAVLTHPGSPYSEEFKEQSGDLARALSVELPLIEVEGTADLKGSVSGLRGEQVSGLLVLADILFISNPHEVVQAAASSGVPAVYPDRAFIEAGGLMFYGAALPSMYRHAATYVDKICGGRSLPSFLSSSLRSSSSSSI